ncbi:hypothetical protein Zmor_011429 [Zophobas morio]|uniref:Uncharacterized protein n=1 Tax=Zophobas morio TaxID=2755281 RepID=A0AA38IT65_9CUCU|nr:hypothetical protein Zmor_011429 [Zophobas morio]
MCRLELQRIIFLLSVLFYRELKCECRHSYLTFCDDLTDLQKYDVENWREVVIGNENMQNSQLHSLDYDTLSLEKFEKLKILIVVRQLNEIKTNTFNIEPHLTRLEFLKFYGNEIRILKFNTFVDIKLRELSLVNNNIEYIQEEAFDYTDIRSIDLSYNKLERIETDVFTDELLRKGTKELVFRHNKINRIELKSFPSSLEILNLDYNHLTYFSEETYANLYELQELTLSHNRIFQVADYIRLGELTELQVLDLSYNQINSSSFLKSITPPNKAKKDPLLQISLAFNQFRFLDLEGNRLEQYIVSLFGNPWDCQCWPVMAKSMADNKMKRNQCDVRLFGNGQVPYCIYYGNDNCTKTTENLEENDNVDYEHFFEIIKARQDTVGCKLTPEQV